MPSLFTLIKLVTRRLTCHKVVVGVSTQLVFPLATMLAFCRKFRRRYILKLIACCYCLTDMLVEFSQILIFCSLVKCRYSVYMYMTPVNIYI